MRIYKSTVVADYWFQGSHVSDKSLSYYFMLKEDNLKETPSYVWVCRRTGFMDDGEIVHMFSRVSLEQFENWKYTNRFMFQMNNRWELLYTTTALDTELTEALDKHIFQIKQLPLD